ncbi:epsin-2-like isoform X2 [Babylonia areolata]|uniref:epsin-2-like isoform X2 n=1 Tax=Babylonia areolata TaxID=304850 RepID=UPI003FCFED5A
MPPIRRTLKNVVKNYSDAQVKVREATSNDPWGPSSTLMSEVSDLTYNVVAFTEIMQMVWKRLNDDGKNWRHVYKALMLLEYIIKTGSEKVAQQCKENFHAIKTLTSFQHIDVDNKDQGMNVREKAKQLVALLSDDERLKNERAKAIKAKERFAQNSGGMGSAGPGPTPTGKMRLGRSSPGTHSSPTGHSDSFGDGSGYNDSSPGSGDLTTEMENARPSSPGEEELQLQLALALSKEEHDEEVKKLQSDELKLQMALEQSKQTVDAKPQQTESLLDLTTSGTVPPAAAASTDPWGMPLSAPEATPKDPWGAPLPAPPPVSSPWGAQASATPAARTTPTLGAAPSPQPQPPAAVDPWGMPVAGPARATPPVTGQPNDPWSSGTMAKGGGEVQLDAFGAPVAATSGEMGATSTIDSEFDLLSARSTESSPAKTANKAVVDEFDLLGGGGGTGGDTFNMGSMQQNLPNPSRGKSPEDFLGANAALVNLDQLVANVPTKGNNPFAAPAPAPTSNNPFHNGSGERVGMAQMTPGFSQPAQATALPAPLMPMNTAAQPLQPQNTSYNPFL